MKVSRKELLPLAEDAVRAALRDAIREAIRDVSQEDEMIGLLAGLRKTRKHPRRIPVTAFRGEVGTSASWTGTAGRETREPHHDLSDEEAWERFNSIRFALSAGAGR